MKDSLSQFSEFSSRMPLNTVEPPRNAPIREPQVESDLIFSMSFSRFSTNSSLSETVATLPIVSATISLISSDNDTPSATPSDMSFPIPSVYEPRLGPCVLPAADPSITPGSFHPRNHPVQPPPTRAPTDSIIFEQHITTGAPAASTILVTIERPGKTKVIPLKLPKITLYTALFHPDFNKA